MITYRLASLCKVGNYKQLSKVFARVLLGGIYKT